MYMILMQVVGYCNCIVSCYQKYIVDTDY